MAFFTSIFKKDDPFNAWMKAAAPVAVLVIVPLVVLLQQFKSSLYGETTSEPPAALKANEDAMDPGLSGLVLESKAIVKSVFHKMSEEDPTGAAARRPFGDPEHPETMEHKAHLSRDNANKMLKELSRHAVSRTDRFRVAIVAGELLGPGSAHERLEALGREAEPGGALAADIGWLSPWYQRAAKGDLTPLPDDVQRALMERHGWFGKLAVSHQQAAGDPLRWEVVSGAQGLMTFEVLHGLWMVLTFVAGSILAVIMFLKIRGFEPAMVETDVERSVYAETFAVFLIGFLVLLAVDIFVIGQTGAWAVLLGQALLWSASAACLYPLLRGVTFSELRIDLGWTSGEGIAKEVGAGVLGYLAGLPLHWIYRIGAAIVEHAVHGDGGGGGGGDEVQYPLFPMPSSTTWAILLIGAMSSCLWAPFFEETFFRGALHRYLPSKFGIMGRVAITAVIFGAVHPYGPTGLIDVALAGVVFGLLREWRGSLIAPMVAHFLNNATIEFSELVPVYLLR